MILRRWAMASVPAVTLFAAAGETRAETLLDAVNLAYKANPTLQQQRSAQRAIDEEYVQACAELRPTISASGGDSYERLSENTETYKPGAFSSQIQNAGVTLSQPLYTGGGATEAIRAAERDVLQGRELLRAAEAQVMVAAIQAYVDVIRDTEALRINTDNLVTLQKQVKETSAELDLGQVTRTDMAQAEARLAAAQASLSAAQGQLQVSRANYAQVVGQMPGELAPAPPLPGLPDNFEVALDIAEKSNPSLRAVQYAEEAARSRVSEARAAYRPTVTLNAGFQWTREPIGTEEINTGVGLVPYAPNPNQRTVTAGVTVNVPFFSGGQRSSKVRQALEQDNEAVYGVEGQRRQVLQSISQSWALVTSSHAQSLANAVQVKATILAAKGERQEEQAGLRTTIDVLNAEQEMRLAELALIGSHHDEYVASAELLQAMGKLELKVLDPSATVYDPKRNFNRVRLQGWTPLDPVVRILDAAAAPGGGGGGAVASAPLDTELAGRNPSAPQPKSP